MKEELTVEEPPLQSAILNIITMIKPVILKDATLEFLKKCCLLNCGLFTVLKQTNTLKGFTN